MQRQSCSDYLEVFDETHPDDDERFLAIGPIASGIVVVVWTERPENTTRIISTRFATKDEIKRFRQYMEER